MNRLMLALAAAAGMIGGAGAVMAWGAFGHGPAAPERARTEQIVKDYLLSHPEILPEAMGVLRDRETGRQIAAEGAAFTQPYGSAWAGNANAELTIIEYFDYNCGYCRAVLPDIDRLLAANPQVRIVYRELPILAEESRLAARYSLVAAEQGRFREFHRALYAAGPVSPETIERAVAAAGMDAAAAREAATAARIGAEIDKNVAAASRLRMTGTPSWVIGDRVVSSALPLDELQRLVDEARARRRS